MRYGTAEKKVVGGKLLRIEVAFEDAIEDIKITGDFFVHPEDFIEKIETEIEGLYVPVNLPGLSDRIHKLMERNSAELIGISPVNIVSTLNEAMKNGG